MNKVCKVNNALPLNCEYLATKCTLNYFLEICNRYDLYGILNRVDFLHVRLQIQSIFGA